MMEVFKYTKRVQFYETDTMGVVHHSNYLRYFEEARVEWLVARALTSDDVVLAVLETQCRHKRPAFFLDELTVELQAKRQDARILLEYRIWSTRYSQPICTGMSLHILVDKDLKVRKPSPKFQDVLEREVWTGTWL